ncbi:MAG: hypothetical protein ACE5GL_00215 [Calditrichia bacterium]
MFSHSIYAQFGSKLGLAANLNIPTSDFSDMAKSGFGGSGYIIANAIPRMAFTGAIGYYVFGKKEKNTGGNSTEFSIRTVPFLLGLRYYLGSPAEPKPFFGALLSLYSMIIKTKNTTPGSPADEKTDRRGRFGFAPVAGLELSKLDFSVFYMIIPDEIEGVKLNYNHIGFQLGINFY